MDWDESWIGLYAGQYKNNYLLPYILGRGFFLKDSWYFDTGPSIGSLLYSVGGFGLPFFTIGSVGILLAVSLLLLVPKIVHTPSTVGAKKVGKDDEVDDKKNENDEDDKPTMTLLHCIKESIPMCAYNSTIIFAYYYTYTPVLIVPIMYP